MISPTDSWRPLSARRPDRNMTPEVRALEDRVLSTVSGLTAQASPLFLQRLSPVNQPKFYRTLTIAPVTIAGSVRESRATPPAIQFRVIDEYGHDQPHGTIAAQPFASGRFLYSTRIGLSLKVRPGDADGRMYRIIVTAQDPENTQTRAAEVIVPFHVHAS